jgi:hypothetical protein
MGKTAERIDRLAQAWEKIGEESETTQKIPVMNTFIKQYMEVGNQENALLWLEKQKEMGIKPNEFAFVQFFEAAVRQGNLVAAQYWMSEMHKAGLQPNAMIKKAIVERKDLRDAIMIKERMENAGYVADGPLYADLIDLAVKSGERELAQKLGNEMLRKGWKPWIWTLNTLIDDAAMHGDKGAVEKWMCEMRAQNMAPNANTYASLVYRAEMRGEVQEVEQLRERMRNEVSPSLLFFSVQGQRKENHRTFVNWFILLYMYISIYRFYKSFLILNVKLGLNCI